MQIVIVIGKTNHLDTDKQRFVKTARELVKGLARDFKMTRGDFIFISGTNSVEVIKKLEEVFLEKSGEDICLFYIGHGSKREGGGWAVQGTSEDILFYSELALVLVHHAGRLIFVNDCCYAGLAEDALQHHPSENLLIASSPKDRVCIYGITNNLLAAWKSGRKYEPKAFVSPEHKEEIFSLQDNVLNNIIPYSDSGEFLDLRLGSDLDHLMISCGSR